MSPAVTPPAEKQRRRLHTALASGGWAGKRGAGLQIAEKRREVKDKREKKVYPAECRLPKNSREYLIHNLKNV